MDMVHLQPFLDAMHRGDKDGLAEHMTEGVTLRSPIVEQPFEGTQQVLGVLSMLLSVADGFEVTNMIAGERNAAVFVTIRAGDVTVEGVDDMHIDAEGKVSGMTIQWRPLSAIVAMQQLMAPLIGISAMKLVNV